MHIRNFGTFVVHWWSVAFRHQNACTGIGAHRLDEQCKLLDERFNRLDEGVEATNSFLNRRKKPRE